MIPYKKRKKTPTILMAEDDPDDRVLIEDAFLASELPHDLRFVADGEDLMAYLFRTGKYNGTSDSCPRPVLILLDLNMPKKDGREVLLDLKSDPELKVIPVVILTTSTSVEDISRSYALGANSYIIKPETFEDWLKIVETLYQYWFEIALLPILENGSRHGGTTSESPAR